MGPRVAIVAVQLGARAVLGADGLRTARGARLLEWAGALCAADHDIDLYLRRDGAGELSTSPAGVRVVEIPVGPAGPISEHDLLARLAEMGHWLGDRWAGQDPPDVVHALTWHSGLVAVAAAREVGVPVVQSFETLAAGRRGAPGVAPALHLQRIRCEQALGRSVDRVVALSRDEMTALGRLGVPRARMSLIPPGVNTDRFTSRGPLAPRPADRPRLLVVGEPSPDSGHGDLLHALRGVLGVNAVAVGADPGGWWGTHSADAAAAGVDWYGPVAPIDMPRWLRSADVVVCPARYDPWGTVAIEAMACGVPVVASAVGGLAEAVVDRLTGDLVPPGDPARLAVAIRRLINDDVRRLAYATAALDRARHCFTWTRCATQLAGVYRSALALPAVPVTAGSPVT